MRTHVFTLLSLLAVAATPAAALTVDIDAPDAVRPLLVEHLEAARAARRDDAPDDAEELARLQRQSEETAHELLATEGYFSPQVTSTLERIGDDWRIQYRVELGPRTRIRRVDLAFDGALATRADAAPLRASIREELPLAVGEPFRQAEWDAAKIAALRPLLGNMYPAARIGASEARIDPAVRAADLALTIDSGPAFFYGEPVIQGVERYPAYIVRDLNPARRGRPYRQQDLLDYQAALEASGYYAEARVHVEPDPAQAAAVPVQVSVVERPTKRFSVGAGVSTDTGARVQAGWLHRDIADRGLRLQIEGRLETARQAGQAELAWPRNATGYENSLGVRIGQEDIEGQETRSMLLAARRNRMRGEIETTLTLQYQTEEQTVADVLSERNQALTAHYTWTRRSTGRALYPRRGHVLTLQGGGAAEALLSDTSFIRLYARHTQFFPVGDQDRIVLRAELGSVLSDRRAGIPTDFLFRAGGDNSIRGYAYQSIGRDLAGGVASVRHLATASAEYNHFFTRTWGAAVFVDAGDAADSLGSLAPVFGYGVGARYRSPIGPVNLDVAYGEATDEFRLHFSLGVTF